MPLIKRKSDKALSHNIKAEMDAGKPKKQALAIALDVQRRARKSKGGRIVDIAPEASEKPSSMAEAIMKKRKMAHGGEIDIAENAKQLTDSFDDLTEEAVDSLYESESAELDKVHNPLDSTSHDVDLEDADERGKSMISKIRSRMKSRM